LLRRIIRKSHFGAMPGVFRRALGLGPGPAARRLPLQRGRGLTAG